MDKRDPIVKLWRDRLAKNARTFRKVEGRWPGSRTTFMGREVVRVADARDTLRRIKAAFEEAAGRGIRPPYIH